MRRRDFLPLLAGAAGFLSSARLRAQRPATGKHRIAVLERTPAARNTNFVAFREALAELGYSEGKNLIIEYRWAEERGEAFAELAAELVRLDPEVIVTRGTPAAIAAKAATTTIPVVMAAIGEPLRVVSSLAHPGGNLTGLTALVVELEGKRVELLRELVPNLTRMAALKNPDNPENAEEWAAVSASARLLGIEARLFAVRTPEEIEAAFSDAREWGAGGVLVGLNSLVQANAARIAAVATRERLPTIHAAREFVDAGGLLSYGVKFPELYRRAAAYIDKILKGTKPADLPIEQPTKFELVINLKTAKALGLNVPQSLLARADEVIE